MFIFRCDCLPGVRIGQLAGLYIAFRLGAMGCLDRTAPHDRPFTLPISPPLRPQGTGQASGLSSKPTGRVGRTRQSKAPEKCYQGQLCFVRFTASPLSTTAGEPPVALGVLRDETAEEWERVALMQDGSMACKRRKWQPLFMLLFSRYLEGPRPKP